MIIRIFAFIFLFFGLCMPAYAKRIALVIGNAGYSELSYLQKTHGDAGGYRDALSQLGFEVTHKTDLDFRGTATTVGSFIGRIQPGDEVAFVFAGHGWSDGRTNYLLPTDAPRGGNDTMLAQLSLPLKNGVSGILDQITARGATLSFSVIDACRDNPFIQPDGTRSAGLARGGLSAVSASAGSFVVYSAGEGQTALDRLSNTDSNSYSVFSRVFIPKLTSGISLEQAANEAQLEVSQLAAQIGHNQAPAYYDQALGSTYLRMETTSLVRIAVTPNPAPVTQPIAPAGNAAQEAYNTARAIGTRQAFETVVTRYSGTQWAEFAAAEITKLSPAPVPPATPQVAGLIQQASGQLEVATLRAPGAIGPRPSGGLAAVNYDHCIGGDVRYCSNLGVMYKKGQGVAQNFARAVALYRLACEIEGTIACDNLGILYRDGIGVIQDYARAVALFRQGCDRGSTGCNNAGAMYGEGRGVAQDYTRAVALFRQGCDHGEKGACTNLAVMYRDGNSVTQDSARAVALFRQACDLGDTRGCDGLRQMR